MDVFAYALGDCIAIYLLFLFFRLLFRNANRSIEDFHNLRTETDLRSLSIKEPLLPYRRRDYLLSMAEKNFYNVLKKIADEYHCEVFAKVRLEDLLWIPSYTRHLLKWRGYISSRHIDFVLCDEVTLRPLCAIELDDSSHNTPSVIQRDIKINKILNSAGLPLLRIKAAYSYNPQLLATAIDEKVSNENFRIPIPARTIDSR